MGQTSTKILAHGIEPYHVDQIKEDLFRAVDAEQKFNKTSLPFCSVHEHPILRFQRLEGFPITFVLLTKVFCTPYLGNFARFQLQVNVTEVNGICDT